MVRSRATSAVVLAALIGTACSGAGQKLASPSTSRPESQAIAPGATADDRRAFDGAVEQMRRHDRDSDWTPARCAEVAEAFAGSWRAHRIPEAAHGAALAWRRCHDDDKARKLLHDALAAAPSFAPAELELAMIEASSSAPEQLDRAIATFDAVLRREPVAALDVRRLAELHVRRARQLRGADREGHLSIARSQLGALLSREPGDPDALNQLAIAHLVSAEGRWAEQREDGHPPYRIEVKGAAREILQQALKICMQTLRDHPSHVGLLTTLGIVQARLGETPEAIVTFGRAVATARSTAALANLAAVRLHVRDFRGAEEAFDRVLGIAPDDYDAHLGRAVSISGQLDGKAPPYDESRLQRIRDDLAACRRIAPERPELEYNEALFLERSLDVRGPGFAERAREICHHMETFISKAGSASQFASQVKRARDRCDPPHLFIREGQAQAAIEAARQERESQQPQESEEVPTGEPAPPLPAPPKP
jgi:tetratricopeptide (TPR) repeat protein